MQSGDAVTDFSLVDDAGNRWQMGAHTGAPVLLIFHRHLM